MDKMIDTPLKKRNGSSEHLASGKLKGVDVIFWMALYLGMAFIHFLRGPNRHLNRTITLEAA